MSHAAPLMLASGGNNWIIAPAPIRYGEFLSRWVERRDRAHGLLCMEEILKDRRLEAQAACKTGIFFDGCGSSTSHGGNARWR
jgi:hypothetical protein